VRDERVVVDVRHLFVADAFYLTERINEMLSPKSFHPHTRQLDFTIPCYKIELTGLWGN
jgi:hypothetical protein